MYSVLKNIIIKSNTTKRYSNVLSKYKVGDSVTVKRKITIADLETFTRLSGDANPVHSKDENGRAIVHGAFLNGLVSAVIGTQVPGPGTLVVSQNLHFPNKCYAGEEVCVNVQLVEDRKIMKVQFKCEVEEEKKIVLYGDARLIFDKK